MNIKLKYGNFSAEINPYGAELSSLKGSDGHEYMWQGDTWAHHAPVLFPLCGKIKDNTYTYRGKKYNLKGHGFAPKSDFEVVEKEESRLLLRLSSSEKTKESYPFDFELYAEYLLGEGALTARYTVKNTGDDTLPYMFGWHPAFLLEGETAINDFYVELPEAKNLTVHPLALERGPFVTGETFPFPLKDGKLYIDGKDLYPKDTYILTGAGNKCTLAAEGEKHPLKMSFSENLPYFCIWKWETDEERFLCLEPWSDSPCDGIQDEDFETRKMNRLLPGKSEVFEYVVKI